MSDKRTEAIKDLEDVIAIADGLKGLPSQYGGIIISLDKIDSLRFALESLKADASDKTDRGEVIATLTEHLNHWKRLLSEGICTKDEGEKTINALNFAIESIKVDRAYDLAYEKVDFIEIPEGATFGNMIKAVFNIADEDINEGVSTIYVHTEKQTVKSVSKCSDVIRFDKDFWDSPYRKER